MSSRVVRRNYLIDRGFQLKYTLVLVVAGAAISLLFGAMMYHAHVVATELMDLPDQFRSVVSSRDDTLLWVVLGIAAVMAVALGLFGVLVTHRVAGPVFVFSHYLQVLAQGRYPKLRPLRKGDELKEFYETFHEAVEAMRGRDRTDGETLRQVAQAIDEAARRSPELSGSLGPASEKLKVLSQRLMDAAASEDPATPGQKAEAAASPKAA